MIKSNKKILIPIILIIFCAGFLTQCSRKNTKKQNIDIIDSGKLSNWNYIGWKELKIMFLLHASERITYDTDYSELIKNPAKTSFSPTLFLLEFFIKEIKDSYVYEINESILRRSCERELGRLFKASGLNTMPSLVDYEIDNTFAPQLIREYGNRINQDLLIYASIKGLINGLDDPFSGFSRLLKFDNPKNMKMYKKNVTDGYRKFNELVGVNIKNNPHKNTIVVLDVYDNESGLSPGDEIKAIDGLSTAGMTTEEAIYRLSGNEDKRIHLIIKREGCKNLVHLKTLRKKIKDIKFPKRLEYSIIDKRIGYIRIRAVAFSKTMDMEKLDHAIEYFRVNNVKGLILDFRNTGMPLYDLPSSIESLEQFTAYMQDFCSRFMEQDKIIFRKFQRIKGENTECRSRYIENRLNLPVIVLVNRCTSGILEMAGGALKDNNAARLLGEETFASGILSQIPYDLGGTCLYSVVLTLRCAITPGGTNISKTGLKPNITVRMKPALVGGKNDIQLKHAMLILK